MSDINNQYLIRRQQVVGQVSSTTSKQNTTTNKPKVSFEDVLSQVQGQQELKFSKHAMSRLEERDIKLTTEEVGKISDAVKKAENKGIRDALILMDDKVFIANVKSRTIVTAASENQLKESVFTNIDGAVIV